MKVLLIVPVPPRTSWPKGLYRTWTFDTQLVCAATVLRRAGHEVRILHREEQLIKLQFDWERAEAQLHSAIGEFRPDLVVQSVVTPAMPEAVQIACWVKGIVGPQAINVLCGTHPSGVPDLTLSESRDVDAVALGEYEMTLRDVADRGSSRDIPGLVLRDSAEGSEKGRSGLYSSTKPLGSVSLKNGKDESLDARPGFEGEKSNPEIFPPQSRPDLPFSEPGHGSRRMAQRPTVQDVDTLGPPAYDLLDMDFYRQKSWTIRYLNLSSVNVCTSRGCPNRCAFCAEHLVSGVGVRFHSLDYVMEQVTYACERLGVEAVHFEDDTLGADRERLLAICEAMQRKGFHKRLQWDCLLRVDQAQPELLAAMKAAGCIQIEYGFESGSDRALKGVGKNATVEQNRRAVSLTREADIRIFADIMVGLPGETREDLNATVRFLRWARPEILSAGRLLPMPGTVLYNRLPQHIRASLSWEGYCYTSQPGLQVNLTDVPDTDFERWYRDFFKYVVKPHNTLALLCDSSLTDQRARNQYQRYWRRFALRHPIRAVRLPIPPARFGGSH